MSKKQAAIELAKETLTGDLRDACLQWLRTFAGPWEKISEAQQATIIESLTKQAEAAAKKAVEIIAADGKTVTHAAIDSITIKDGLKIVCKAALTEDNVVRLGLRNGSTVLLTVADAADYTGEKEAAKPDPDQRSLLGD